MNPLIGFRNRVVPAYDTMDDERVYQLIRDERGNLPKVLRAG